MIETEVKKLGADEHIVRVRIPQSEYDRIYAEQLEKLRSRIRLPGFRPGRTPPALVEKQFGAKAREEAITEIVNQYYAEAIDKSGLSPAMQPEIELPTVQQGVDFEFSLKVVTWPHVELRPLADLRIDKTEIEVADEDVQDVAVQLLKKPVRFEIRKGRKARMGDEVIVDFNGSIDGAPLDGGQGEDVHLVLGAGRFFPEFEDGLVGASAGEERTIEVCLPEDTGGTGAAKRVAVFEVKIKSVGVPVKARNEKELASMLGFADVASLREDIQARLAEEAIQAEWENNREAAFAALLAAHEISLPEAMVRQEMKRIGNRIARSMREDGVGPAAELFESADFQAEIRRSAEKALKTSVLIEELRERHGIEVGEAEIGRELERLAAQYPAEKRSEFKAWMRGQKAAMDRLRSRVLEKKCVDFLMQKATIHRDRMSFSEWRRRREAGHADTVEKETV